MESKGGFVSAISIWEIGIKVQQKTLELPLSLEDYVRRLEDTGVIRLLPVDVDVWLKTLSLEWSHRDPADRVIVASALLQGVPLLSKDPMICSFSGVESLW